MVYGFGFCAICVAVSLRLAQLEFKRQNSTIGWRFSLAVLVLVLIGSFGVNEQGFFSVMIVIPAFFFALMTIVAQLMRVYEPRQNE